MSDYTPPDALNVILNFTKELKPVDSQNLVLNFGAEDGFNYANISIDTSFRFSATGTVELPIDVHGSANILIDTAFAFEAVGTFDINHIVGVSLNNSLIYQKALPSLSAVRTPWSKPILRALNRASFYDTGLTQLNVVDIKNEEGKSLAQNIRTIFEETTGLNSDLDLSWQENIRLKKQYGFDYKVAERKCIERQFDWVELVRKRKQFTYSHEVAKIFENTYQFEWDKGLEIVTANEFVWQIARPIYYRKHPIQPWQKPEPLKYVGSTNLEFNCLCTEVDSHNVILNFGVDDCIPAIKNQNWWYIMNEVSIINTRTNEEIIVLNGKYGSDRSRWCWSYSLTVAEPEMSKLQKFDVLKITVNGNIHMMMYEDYSKSQVFAKTIYTLSGRSQSALLESQYSPVRSYLQENERTSVQLVQAELDRVNSNTQLNWQLIDELGWIVESESLSYTNQAPIDAIKMIAEAGGGFVYSEKDCNTLSIKPLYKKTYWDAMEVSDYDSLIPESLVTQHSENYQELLNYNAITLTNPRNGNTGLIKRRDTAGDILLEPVANPLFNAVSMGSFGRAELAKSGRVEDHVFNMPISQKSPEQVLGDVFAFDGKWQGIVDAVDVSFTYSKVEQTVKVERIVNE
ncbi:hypothetical protein EXE10_01645 [Acinetobacter sp. WCHAc060033]|uniref:hypothetical protein n=1 Tax=Acinetobacter sp. WCHAc060033 TaxID=2518624 RepID=UPI00102371C2|nr:hypothetical protein [Acinetobacter sp. WCHAc060033]RZG88532.1 hypothetical protein EXE10_01645 [Acinetobacter sp. WCHAc060033]